MRPTLLLALLAFTSSSLFAQSVQLAPYTTTTPSATSAPNALIPPSSAGMSTSGTGCAGTLEDFETYTGLGSGAVNLLTLTLDELTIANGQGPGLVVDGCVYSCSSNSMQWDGAGYYGAASQAILGNTGDGQLTLTYDTVVGNVCFDLFVFDGFADTATVQAFDAGGVLLTTQGPVALPNAVAVPFQVTASGIKTIVISGSAYSWSPIIDNHIFGAGGPTLTITGPCPGPATITVSGATAFGSVAIAYGAAGSFTIPSGSCTGTVIGISSPTLAGFFNADLNGDLSLTPTLPSGACGLTVQAVDMTTCATTNTVVL